MANCQSCGRHVYAKQASCSCGAKIHTAYQYPPERRHLSNPSAEVNRAFGQKLDEVNSYIAGHAGATKREACLFYLHERGLFGLLPASIKRESDAEAIAEREAIQAEANGYSQSLPGGQKDFVGKVKESLAKAGGFPDLGEKDFP